MLPFIVILIRLSLLLSIRLTPLLKRVLPKLSELESPTLEDLIRWRLEVAKDLPYLSNLEKNPAIKDILETVSPERLQKFSHILDFQTPYKFTFNQAGFQAVISERAKNGYVETVDEMSAIIINLIGSYQTKDS